METIKQYGKKRRKKNTSQTGNIKEIKNKIESELNKI